MDSSEPERDDAARRRPNVVLGALFVAVVGFAFQQTAVIPALPTIQQELHATRAWSAWLVTGYLVASSVLTPFLGKLGDRAGKRRMLLVALGLFLLGSIGAAAVPALGGLIAFRALQGAGGAVFPLALALVRDEIPRERVGRAIGVLTAGFGLGTTLGFAGAGALVQALGWRAVFVAGAIVVAAATTLVFAAVPASGGRTRSGLDLGGGALLAAGLGVLLVALTEGEPQGWTSPWVLGGFGLAAVLLAGWVAHDVRAEEPLIELRVLGERTVFLANAASLSLGFMLFGVYFLLPFLVEGTGRAGYGFGADPLQTGLFLLPAAAGQLTAGPLLDPLSRRLSAKWTFAAGMAVGGGGCAGLALLHDRIWAVALWALLVGFGNGLAIGVASTLVTQAVRDSETGIATALNSVVRRVGGGIGGQVVAAVLAAVTVAGTTVPTSSAFAISFWVCAAAGGAGALLAVGIRRRPA